MKQGFSLTQAPNPHIQRGKDVVGAHPEVKEYFGPYPLTGLCVLGVVFFQVGAAYLLRDSGWLWMLLCAYLVGAFASHALFVLIHEAGHNLIAKTSNPNRLWGILCNVGQGVPTAISFRIFHGLHHSHLDEYDYDGDLAFHWEARLVGRSPIRKALWLLMFPFIEIIRPMRIRKAFFDRWTALNFVAIAVTDFLIYWSCGLTGLAYVVLSTVFGVGLHVVGARWVQEHYTFKEGQETYSYYGPINTIAFNIGYHNEHHDLVRVPWVHLPKIKALAPEFYEPLYAHRSWTRVLLQFLFDPNFDLYSRITRDRSADRQRAAA
jgi:sphingolipid 4-desaturase/C4-monooxygenase